MASTNPTPAPKQSIWSKIGNFFKHAGVVVAGWFEAAVGSDAAHTFATGAEALLETALGQIAWTAVNNAQSLASNTEKFTAAASAIKQQAEAQGIQVKDSLINMLIELAVQRLKTTFGPPPATN